MPWLAKVAVATAWLMTADIASAQSNLDAMLQQADFVFEGVVTDVQNRFSTKTSDKDPEPAPYTFVTYKINSILKGNYQGSYVTLRFLGGAVDASHFVSSPDQPLFDVGDHDLLLVKGNGRLFCPLVNCAQGRFRYIQGLVVNEVGQTIELDHTGAIKTGKTVELKEINTHKVSDTIAFERVESLQPGEASEWTPLAQINRNTLPTPDGFTSTMQQKVFKTHDSATLGNLPPLQSADPNKPFVDAILKNALNTPVKPPAPVAEHEIPLDEQLEFMLAEKYRDQILALRNDPEAQERFIQSIRDKYPEVFSFRAPTNKKEEAERNRKLRAAIAALQRGGVVAPASNIAETRIAAARAEPAMHQEASGNWLPLGAGLLLLGITGGIGWRWWNKKAR